MNLAVLRGHLSRAPESRLLPSGDELVAYEVTVREPDERTASVPVVWVAPRAVPRLDRGDEVVVVGRVRRRFFRAGGATASRTEVVADRVVPAHRRRSVDAALRTASDRLGRDRVP
jgi:single-strand DNA-binding protein